MDDVKAEMDEWINSAPVGARRRWNALYDVVIEEHAGVQLVGVVYVGPRPPRRAELPVGCQQRCALDRYHDEILAMFGAFG